MPGLADEGAHVFTGQVPPAEIDEAAGEDGVHVREPPAVHAEAEETAQPGAEGLRLHGFSRRRVEGQLVFGEYLTGQGEVGRELAEGDGEVRGAEFWGFQQFLLDEAGDVSELGFLVAAFSAEYYRRGSGFLILQLDEFGLREYAPESPESHSRPCLPRPGPCL